MPLKNGSTDEVICENVTALVNEGMAQDTAVFQAYRHAGRSHMDASLAAAAMSESPAGHEVARPDASGFRGAAPRALGHVAR